MGLIYWLLSISKLLYNDPNQNAVVISLREKYVPRQNAIVNWYASRSPRDYREFAAIDSH